MNRARNEILASLRRGLAAKTPVVIHVPISGGLPGE
jgi:hypothetical protein